VVDIVKQTNNVSVIELQIEECVDICRRSGATGWDLVEFAQCAVMSQMTYSYDNPLVMPKRTFEQGGGYCV